MGRRSSQGIASIPRLLAATLAAAALLTGLAGCAGPTNGTQSASPASGDQGSSAQGQDSPQQGPVSTLRDADANGRLASSLSAYIDEVLADPYVSDYERPFLEQAKKEGRVSTAVYEKVWSDYKTCMVDHGFPEPKLERFPNGMMDIMQHAVGTDEQEDRWRDAYADCYLRFSHVQGLYGQQQGNPNLYANVDEAVVDCMRREGVVPRATRSRTSTTGRPCSRRRVGRTTRRTNSATISVTRACAAARRRRAGRRAAPTTPWSTSGRSWQGY